MKLNIAKLCAFLAVTSAFALPAFAEETLPGADSAATVENGAPASDEAVAPDATNEDLMTRHRWHDRDGWRWRHHPRFEFRFRFGPRYGWGYGHRGVWTCVARNASGRDFVAQGWNLSNTRFRAMRACEMRSRFCRFLGCR